MEHFSGIDSELSRISALRFGFVANATNLRCRANHRFRLASYSDARLFETVAANLDCLETILHFAVTHGIGFYRISSDTVPFASHPVCRADWLGTFASRFAVIGTFIRRNKIRISMHPGQFTLLNTPSDEILARSISELRYHAMLLDGLLLDQTARIQLHVGGVYGDKSKSLANFCRQYDRLEPSIRARLTIENDDHKFSLQDCLAIHAKVGIPIVFDTLHHRCLNSGESIQEGLIAAGKSWRRQDGIPMVDYSSQRPGYRRGTHAETLDANDFLDFLGQAKGLERDVMVELRDKEESVYRAIALSKKFC